MNTNTTQTRFSCFCMDAEKIQARAKATTAAGAMISQSSRPATGATIRNKSARDIEGKRGHAHTREGRPADFERRATLRPNPLALSCVQR